MEKEKILTNIDKIHTTDGGIKRIKNNLKLKEDCDIISYCKDKITQNNSRIYKEGKNWYCIVDNIKLTINSYSYTIITAHTIK